MKLAVRAQHVVGPRERVVRLLVFCPGKTRSIDYAECRACPRVSTVPARPGDPGACIECVPPKTARRIPDFIANAGRDGPVGSLAGPFALCLDAALPMDRVRVAFREAPAAELPVVDELGHVLGIVRREDFQRARRNGDPAETFHRPQQAVDRLDRATTLSESSSVQQAVEALVSHHSRNLVLLRDDATLAGVLTDLDLLRWVSQERRLSAR